jgi:hypothetical protein
VLASRVQLATCQQKFKIVSTSQLQHYFNYKVYTWSNEETSVSTDLGRLQYFSSICPDRQTDVNKKPKMAGRESNQKFSDAKPEGRLIKLHVQFYVLKFGKISFS